MIRADGHVIEINGYVSDLAAARQSRAADLVLRYLGLLTELRATFGSAGPDPGTYVRVLSVLADAGRAADADAVLASMRDSDDGPAPCVACYNALLNAHAEDAGAVGCPGRRCEDVLRALEAAGLRPDAHTYGTLVKAWGRSATSDAAERAQRYAAEMDAADGAGGGEGGRAGIDAPWCKMRSCTRGAGATARRRRTRWRRGCGAPRWRDGRISIRTTPCWRGARGGASRGGAQPRRRRRPRG